MKSNQEQKVKVKRMNLYHQSVDKKEEKGPVLYSKNSNTMLFLVSPQDSAVVL